MSDAANHQLCPRASADAPLSHWGYHRAGRASRLDCRYRQTGPYIVELEQINSLIAPKPTAVHSPAVEQDPVREMLNQLRLLAPTLVGRKPRTLAELDRQADELNPVPGLEARADQLERLAHQSGSSGEQEALHEELGSVAAQLRDARRN